MPTAPAARASLTGYRYILFFQMAFQLSKYSLRAFAEPTTTLLMRLESYVTLTNSFAHEINVHKWVCNDVWHSVSVAPGLVF
jgi:hypothetical protein